MSRFLDFLIRLITCGKCDVCERVLPLKDMVRAGHLKFCGTWCRDLGSKR
jgi:hypothetical protein